VKNDEVFLEQALLVAKNVGDKIELLKIGLASEAVYEKFWHWFCDDSIERSKKDEISNKALVEVLKLFLVVLHPFVPFVTEAVWQEMKFEGLLIEQKWPDGKN